MARNIFEYDDIIDREKPRSKRHNPMPPDKRAAQFAPFAALVGYDEIVSDAAQEDYDERVTREKFEPAP